MYTKGGTRQAIFLGDNDAIRQALMVLSEHFHASIHVLPWWVEENIVVTLWEKFCATYTTRSATDWDPSKFTNFNRYFDKDSACYPSQNIYRNMHFFSDLNDSVERFVYVAEVFSVYGILNQPNVVLRWFYLLINPFLPTVAFSQLSSNICCPRDCVSRHKGGTSGAPLKPLRDDSAIVFRR